MSRNKSVNRLFLAVVVIYIVGSLGFGILFSQIPAFAKLPIYVSLLVAQSLIFLPCFIYCKWKIGRIRDLIPYRKINFVTIILIVICTYLMYPLIVVLNAISMLFSNSGTASVAELMQGQNLILNLLFMAVLPACVEEFLFRGVLFQTYRKSKMLPAIFLSSFMFGCMHMNLNQFIYAFALGVYLAFLVEATGSIFSSMLAHFTLNATSAVMSYFLPVIYEKLGLDATDQLQQIQPGGYASTIATTAAAVGLYIAICKINGRWGYVKGMFRQGDRERIITIPLVLGVLIAFAFMIYSIVLEQIVM